MPSLSLRACVSRQLQRAAREKISQGAPEAVGRLADLRRSLWLWWQGAAEALHLIKPTFPTALQVAHGYRRPIPLWFPPQLGALIVECWDEDPDKWVPCPLTNALAVASGDTLSAGRPPCEVLGRGPWFPALLV
jgi:hypothetical protein